ncbi:MAG TPA: formate-dependent phosphoribosylglycinamide formyltransferase [Polyangiaceae bacterium LLY-WYZ-15_(1-7)]|nr:phosphoribosylglycinamide formyltransferase 2 [Sandaracinus sp.]HJK92495.1 formate-dependent phosphoribosylglycinamide formyltransferase [Polyangiaceae bacterium LLY-WYZ-15_(1-7)]MBJ70345.1 phosphoribosylglycinamide formyltransferase 2 [Sandaracinus sp.]HJL01561.1 formate-dependent phosphoribosylglycinamide formyltransferase [Polyangiaceae bacterium LLY-WYZ-15_(1-7)]HJL08601.1 formate-dependent phosphoribosylglycinamide formyltransferase [Polyangiaceae bacterium LLY-WYZ-15_(1-7)]
MTIRLGTPNTATKTKVLLLGSGELGKEVALELQRLGVHVVACDRYDDAPAMQVAHARHVFPMLDAEKLRAVVEEEKPDFIVPEIEAIATDTLLTLEREGHTVIPTARAARLTMDREGIRRLAAETLGLPTSPYRFAETEAEFRAAVEAIGLPCVVKPIMSSSGKGQSTIREASEIDAAWKTAIEGARGTSGRVIVEGFIDFDYEITLLTVRHLDGAGEPTTSFCAPVGHRQVGGDYHESWQPQPMSEAALAEAQRIAKAVTDDVGGRGLFGVELFVKGDTVWFSEVSPRPHDTGMVTLITQDLSEFALHARAILGLPIPNIHPHGPGASYVILGHGESQAPAFSIDPAALTKPDTSLRLFGKPEVKGERRLGVGLARGATLEEARAKAKAVAEAVTVEM